MRDFTLALMLTAVLLVGASVVEAQPPAKIQRLPSIGGVPGNGGGYGYGYGMPYGGYGTSSYISPYGTGYRSSSYYTSPFGYGSYSNSGYRQTPFGPSYYRNSGYQLAPGIGYSSGVNVTPWGVRAYGYGY